jgi:transposase-like protein
MDLFKLRCPECKSQEIKKYCSYKTKNYGQRLLYQCCCCKNIFSETKSSFLERLRTPIVVIFHVIKARTEGLSFNAACRVFEISKNTLLSWEKRFANLKKVLFLFALVHQFLKMVVEGDEIYTKVNKNENPEDARGWTIILMERASRFIWVMECGKKNKKLFRKAIRLLCQVIAQTGDIGLITDGERRYGNILFEICRALIRTGKRGRPKRTLKRGVKVRIKNKGSQSRKRGRKRPKYQSPVPEHPETSQDIENQDIHANHVEGQNAALRRKNSAYRRKTNTYAKTDDSLQRTLDIHWIVHNFIQAHFTTKQVPAVAIGILNSGLSFIQIFKIPMAI